jgi:hypothetical protein
LPKLEHPCHGLEEERRKRNREIHKVYITSRIKTPNPFFEARCLYIYIFEDEEEKKDCIR